MDLKGSETEANLRRAFTGEAHTRGKYALYAEAARREGYEQIAALFEEAAGNELAHARLWLRALEGLGTTEENLLDAAGGEHALWTHTYPEMARIAREEGFEELAARFEGVAQAERAHEVRFLKLLENLRKGQAFRRGGPVLWYCRNCGRLEWRKDAPAACPACGAPRGFFEIRSENY